MCVCVWRGGGGVFADFRRWVINCRCLYARARSHSPSKFDSVCARLCALMCGRESNCKKEKDWGGGGGGG